MKYRFITFEGVEGSGKSTQAKLLHEFLRKKNYDAILTREPGGARISEKIREILLDENLEKLEAKTEILLNFAARLEHIEKLIKPAMRQEKIVISDRFFDSTFAYQGYGFGCDLELISEVKDLAIDGFEPDITFVIDVPVETAFKRIHDRSTNNRYEKLSKEFHQKTRDGFLEMARLNPARIKVIDGTKSVEEVAEEIVKILNLIIPAKAGNQL